MDPRWLSLSEQRWSDWCMDGSNEEDDDMESDKRYEVRYRQMDESWDERAMPGVFDTARGVFCLEPKQYVGHPGDYDEEADRICIAAAQILNGIPCNEMTTDAEPCLEDLARLCRLLMDYERAGDRGTVSDAVELANQLAAEYRFPYVAGEQIAAGELVCRDTATRTYRRAQRRREDQ